MFVDDAKGADASFVRVVKSIAVPRGQGVLAKAEYDPNDEDAEGDVAFDADKRVVEYVLRAGDIQKDENYQVMNGDYTKDNAMTPSFLQSVKIDLANHLFAYNQ